MSNSKLSPEKVQELALKHSYPMTFEKDNIGGSFSDAFNAGYDGRKGGVYRFKPTSVGRCFYDAGKLRKLIDSLLLAKGAELQAKDKEIAKLKAELEMKDRIIQSLNSNAIPGI